MLLMILDRTITICRILLYGCLYVLFVASMKTPNITDFSADLSKGKNADDNKITEFSYLLGVSINELEPISIVIITFFD
jgi:hypothetical protein